MNENISIPLPVRSGAHWTIYLPTLVVAVVWAGAYLWADTREPPLAGIRSVALAIEAAVVPLLLLHAFLRARVLGAGIADGRFEARWGFPVRRTLHLAPGEIAEAGVRRSFAQRLFGGGAMALRLTNGKQHMVADLAAPDLVVRAIEAAQAVENRKTEVHA